jgi:hypothetical protein
MIYNCMIDLDWEGSADDKKSATWICSSLSFSMMSWDIRKQNFVVLRIAEAEYIVACDACTKTIWIRKMVSILFDLVLDSTRIYCDNQSYVKLSENPVFHDRSKNIEIEYYFIHYRIQRG